MSITQVTPQRVKELREKTGAGMMECKRALEESQGDFDKALTLLREKGLALAQKKAGRITQEGLVSSYIHLGGKIGVLLEVNCETDFVARTPEFSELCHDLCIHIAAASPLFLKREEVPAEALEKEKAIYRAQAAVARKPTNVIEKIVEGKLQKYFEEVCLLEQPFVKAPETSIQNLISQKVAKFGENITIRRFVRFKVGEENTGGLDGKG